MAPAWREQLKYCRSVELPFREMLTNCLVIKNLTNFSKFKGLCPVLKTPWQQTLACVLAGEGTTLQQRTRAPRWAAG